MQWYVILIVLVLISFLCGWAAVADLASGTTRMAHEEHDSSRQTLPLNYWLGVSSKIAGAVLGAALAAVVAISYL